jgi:hypothetical protein
VCLYLFFLSEAEAEAPTLFVFGGTEVKKLTREGKINRLNNFSVKFVERDSLTRYCIFF